VVNPAASGGIGIEQDLEAAIDDKPLWVDIGPDATANPVRRFEQEHPLPGLVERQGANEPRHAGADDDDREGASGTRVRV